MGDTQANIQGIPIELSNEEIQVLQRQLLEWFQTEQRVFPWRQTKNPYEILVAEKLLQQTVARESVIKAYYTMIERYPVVEALAAAEVEDLRAIVAPLGFHYRAEELKALAQAIVERHGGVVPVERKALLALPGVGEYIARAVRSFANGLDVPVVDVNVARLLFRVFGLLGAMPANPARKRALIELAERLVPAGQSRNFNLAILDLCAAICTPRSPKCVICPIQEHCQHGRMVEEIDAAG